MSDKLHPHGARPRGATILLLAGLFLTAPALAESVPDRPIADADLNFTGSYLAARSATAARDLDSAAQFLGRALRGDPDNTDLIERTFLLRLANGEIDGALALADRLIGLDRRNGLARFVIGIKAMKDGQYAEAKPSFVEADRGPVAKLTAGLLVAWSEQGLGNTDAAIAVLDGLEGPDWYAVFRDFHKSLIADVAGRREDALRWMRRAHETDSSGVRMVEGYARILARTGDTELAKRILADYASGTREHPIINQLIDDLAAGKTPEPFVRTVQEGAAEALYSLGVALNTEGGEELSTVYLELAVFLDPKADLARLALGDIFQGTQNHEKAIAAYSQIPDSSILKRVAAIESSLSLDALDRLDDAIAEVTAILERNPGDLEAAMALGDINKAHKRFDEAAAAYSQAIATIKSPVRVHWRLFYSRGIAYERTKQWPLAEADFKKALELFPDQPQVLNYLGYSWVDMGMNLDQALDMIRKAVELRPDDGYIVDSLGWAYYRLGRFDEATTELERAVQLLPEDPTINDHLGDAYWQVGRKLEATFQWSHARDLKPEPEDLAEIVKKLEDGLSTHADNDG